jgi:hypothetical protein
VEFGAAAPGEPGSLHRLERRSTSAQHPLHRLQALYGHPIYFLETFVDPERFRGTCYRAANWLWLGRTTGRGKDDQTGRPNRSIKEVLGYPLTRRFRELLEQG